jgi:hypothetical protein
MAYDEPLQLLHAAYMKQPSSYTFWLGNCIVDLFFGSTAQGFKRLNIPPKFNTMVIVQKFGDNLAYGDNCLGDISICI